MSQERVSGFPGKGADLRGSPGKLPGKPGELPGKFGELPGNPWIALKSTVREVPGKSPKNFRGSSGKKLGGA